MARKRSRPRPKMPNVRRPKRPDGFDSGDWQAILEFIAWRTHSRRWDFLWGAIRKKWPEIPDTPTVHFRLSEFWYAAMREAGVLQ